MPKELRALIEKTVEASHLDSSLKEELRTELESHILAHIYDLELSGLPEKDIVMEIKEAFGDTKEIGREVYYAHHSFERIPLIGPMLYYRPTRMAAKLFAIYPIVAAFFLIWDGFINNILYVFLATPFWKLEEYYIYQENAPAGAPREFIYWLSDAGTASLDMLVSFAPIIVPILLGRWLFKKMGTIKEFTETVLYSYLPILLLICAQVLFAISERGTTIYDAVIVTVLYGGMNLLAMFLVPGIKTGREWFKIIREHSSAYE